MKRRRILTQPQEFSRFPAGMLFAVKAGMPVADALEQASNLLACVENLAVQIGDEANRGGDIFAIQYLAEMAKALVDASSCAVFDAEVGQ